MRKHVLRSIVVLIISTFPDDRLRGGVPLVAAGLCAEIGAPGVLEPGAEEGGEDGGDEEDDEGEGDVGAGVDAVFLEFAGGADDEFGEGPEEGDDALFY